MATVRARCITDSGADLSPSPRSHFYSPRTQFSVTIGRMYQVAAVGIFETVLLALVVDDTNKPNWLPIGLFDFGISSFPQDWRFRVLDGVAGSGGDATGRWIAVWGYAELVESPDQIDLLIERDPKAMETLLLNLDPAEPL